MASTTKGSLAYPRFNHNIQCYEYADGTVASIEICDVENASLLDLFWILSVREKQRKLRENTYTQPKQ